MLAGLIFATADAEDSPETLAATLPFGGATLIEFQARLLVLAGVTHLLVAVERLTPALIGAVNRIRARGTAIDCVRTAADAAARLHPQAALLVVADGLVTRAEIVAGIAAEAGEVLLVTTDAEAIDGLERVSRDAIWAGLARLDAARVAEVAALPADYAFQSTLLRVAAQGGVSAVWLPAGPPRDGHGVEHRAAPLLARNQAILAALVSNRPGWTDRYVVAPVARLCLGQLVRRGVPLGRVIEASGVAALAGLALVAIGWVAPGLATLVLASIGFATGSALAWMRDQPRLAHGQRLVALAGAGGAVALIGARGGWIEGEAALPVAALMLLLLAGLVERAAPDAVRRRWWSSAIAHLLLLLPFAFAGQLLAGLVANALYAAVSLADAVERAREKP